VLVTVKVKALMGLLESKPTFVFLLMQAIAILATIDKMVAATQ
jgi:hypothetical protein